MADNRKWFKVWVSDINDPKFHDHHNQIIGAWVRLGGLIACYGSDGYIKISYEQFLQRCHLQRATDIDVKTIINALAKLDVKIDINNETQVVSLSFLNWKKKQADWNSYERLKKWRNNQNETKHETVIEDKKKRIRRIEDKKIREEEKEEKKENNLDQTLSSFDRFWLAYPKKIGKGAALKSWNRIKPHNGLTEKILQAIETQKGSDQWQKQSGQFIPHPATWLNQGRWDDVVKIDQEKPEWLK